MRKLRGLFLMIMLPTIGFACMSRTPTDVQIQSESFAKEAAELRETVDELFEAASRRDFPKLHGFHLYGPKFTKFAHPHPTRMSAEETRMGEEQFFTDITVKSYSVIDFKADVFGPTFAVVTFKLSGSYEKGGQSFQGEAHTTMVFVKVQKHWRIVHEHMSPTS